MILQQFKNLKINLPPYFVCIKGGKYYENSYYLSYYFSDKKRSIGITYNKKFDSSNKIVIWLSDLNRDKWDEQREVGRYNENISEDKLNKEINNIRFENYFK